MSKGETRPHIGYLLSALFGFVESEAEAEQRQAHFDRFLVRVLHGDLELATGSHGGNELVGERHCDEAPDIGAGLDRLPLGSAVVDLDQYRLREIEAAP